MALQPLAFDNFLNLLDAKQVSTVIFRAGDVLEVVTETARWTTRIITGLSTEWVVQRLVDTKTPFKEGRTPPNPIARRLRAAGLLLFPVLYLWMAYMMMKKLTDDHAGGDKQKKRRVRQGPSSSTAVTWKDVAGMDSARRELEEVVEFMCNPERFRRMGARCPRGVLLSGPPGCGKTMLARAAAHEAGVSIIVCSASDFVEVFVGRGAARVRALFQQADQCSPCILFFDELDALAKSRSVSGFGNDEREQTLNQLLTEMDGFDSDSWGDAASLGNGQGRSPSPKTGNIVVIAATNRPDVLDSALVRPGRFDRHIRVPLPDEVGRLSILKVHLERRNVPLEKVVHLKEVAEKTNGFSGADMGNVVNEACLLAMRGRREAVSTKDLLDATSKCQDMKGGGASVVGGMPFFSPP